MKLLLSRIDKREPRSTASLRLPTVVIVWVVMACYLHGGALLILYQ